MTTARCSSTCPPASHPCPLQPLESLAPEVKVWLRRLGSTATTTRQLMEEDKPGVHPMVQVEV